MEHTADIRYRASTVGPFEFDYCEYDHYDRNEILWLQDTVTDLLDEIERLRRPAKPRLVDVDRHRPERPRAASG